MSEISTQLEHLSRQVAALEAERERLRSQLERPADPAEPGAAYLTVDEAAALARCHSRTIRRAVSAGRLHAFRAPGRFLLRESDVRAWIESQAAAPVKKQAPRSRPRHTTPGSVARLREIERRLT